MVQATTPGISGVLRGALVGALVGVGVEAPAGETIVDVSRPHDGAISAVTSTIPRTDRPLVAPMRLPTSQRNGEYAPETGHRAMRRTPRLCGKGLRQLALGDAGLHGD